MPFKFEETAISGVTIVHPRIFPDDRGLFLETYKRSDFKDAGISESFVQDNLSISSRGILRGIHFQNPPHAQGKLVRVVQGLVWDVAVDLRPDSLTFKQWVGVELDSERSTMLYIPPGFGHAFLVISETAHFSYKCTAEYAPGADGGIRWDDPDLAIEWPSDNILVSDRDSNLPYLKDLV